MQTLHGYTLDETQWKGNLTGQYNIATKSGKKYYIKRLASPRYPDSDNFKGEIKQRKIEICNEWFKRRQEIISAIPGSGSGTIAKPVEYFREGSYYYKVEYMIDATQIPYDEIYKEPKDVRVRIMLTTALALSDLHKKSIVHGDLRPENVVIYRVPENRNPVVKLIGLENAFFENKIPEVIPSEVAWQSPEVINYNQAVAKEIFPNPYQQIISSKLDVYSLGLFFYQFCAGVPPVFETNSSCQEWCEDRIIKMDSKIEPELYGVIEDMLNNDPSKRPSIADIHRSLLYGSPNRKSVKKNRVSDIYIDNKENSIRDDALIELSPGHSVYKVYIHPRNSRKVIVLFANGREQILDKELALKKGYVEKEDYI